MLIVHVQVKVKPEFVEAFIDETKRNAEASRLEPGILRFDVVRADSAPTEFMLVEVYRTDADPAKHKETAHYLRWRDVVEPMMAEPRKSTKYREVSPATDLGWKSA